MVRLLTILALAAGVLWSGWWFVGASAVRAGAAAAVEAARDQGWSLAYDDLTVRGFPNRFDVTLDAPELVDPLGLSWRAPFLQILALSYRPNHVIVVPASEMEVADLLQVTSEDLRASVVVSASRTPALRRSTLVASQLTAAAPGLTLGLTEGQVATRQAAAPLAHDIAVGLRGLHLPEDLQETLPATIESLDIDAQAGFDRPLGGGEPARFEAGTLRSARLVWGESVVEADGDVRVGPSGLLNGTFTIRAEGWEALLAAAVEAGLVPADRLPLITAGLRGLASETGRLEAPAALDDGTLRVLGIPIGQTPRLPVPERS